jgi:hypothetical protein
MQNEITLNKQLSGREVKDAVLFKISQALDKDSTLDDHLAFNSFALAATIIVNLPSAVVQKSTVRVEESSPEEIVAINEAIALENGTEPEGIDEAVLFVKMPEMSPNAVRVETDQPLTVQVQEGRRVIERKVKYRKGTRLE